MISLTADQMREVDELAIGEYGLKLEQMMELAGFNLALLARQMLGGSLEGKGIAILAGKGNNGGGGLVSARDLSNWGVTATILIPSRTGLNQAVSGRLETLEVMGLEILAYDEGLHTGQVLSEVDLIVDSLIGYSLMGAPRPPISDMILLANESGIPILSLDLPSGLDATTGKAHEPCVVAEKTLTLALPKKGLLVEEARKYVGELFLADIGIPPSLYAKIGLEVGNIFGRSHLVKIF